MNNKMLKGLVEAGVALAARVDYAIVLGSLFAWYMLAKPDFTGITKQGDMPF